MQDSCKYEDLQKDSLHFAKLDTDRKKRTGFSETVFCQGKKTEHLVQIYRHLFETTGQAFGTRADAQQAQAVQKELPQAQYDDTSHILKIQGKEQTAQIGCIAVCSAGTSDISVAEEAAQTAEHFGAKVDRYYDVGVAGLDRLLAHIDSIRKANAIIAVAGMEGALPSVIGGMVSVPVIAVPTSIGYGANFSGLSALLAMLNSCANGISVVNIDNGYGAGYNAVMINRLAVQGNRQ
ncbi:MAG: nickel pincer cofactor biosynthesis protein LarB [Treponema sp.]|nr:nickel pincer cofactor biosynthesis protein LarB [Treponema sp.]